jgi:cyclophilin family peptidyl-prolyl cis-trans isomerase
MRRLALLAATGFLLAGCGGSGSPSKPKPDASGCIPVGNVLQKPRSAARPKAKLDPNRVYDVTLVTNCGNFTIRMDQKQSPNATASFVSLVKRGFFDRTVFHRIVPGFVIQGGDPTGTGTGGPGYRTVDRPPSTARYTHGVVAMAKTAAEPPGTAGSQFFVVTAQNAQLTPDYAIIGKVVHGLPVVDRIGKLGDANEVPTETVEIEQARVNVAAG